MNCPNCGFETHIGMRFCGRCGNLLAQTCTSCGFANPPDYLFCGMCGSPISAEGRGKKQRPDYNSAQLLLPGLNGHTPTAEPVPGDQGKVQGERRVATVILADVRRSTDLLERIGTEAWVGIMNQVFQRLNIEIYRFGGTVDQFRGDGLVAFFGTVVAHEDDPERGVLAGLAMQQAVADYSADLLERQGIEIKLRVGVNTGDVIVASIGEASQHQEETAMGEAVTVAARMEAAAEPGTVLVSEDTYRLVESRFAWKPLGEIEVKGLSRPLAVYRPLGPRFDFESGPDLQIYGMPVAMTARAKEFEILKSVVEGVAQGRGRIVLVTGEKGIGKSLLVTQVQRHFNLQPAAVVRPNQPPRPDAGDGDPSSAAITWLRGSCRSYDQAYPFSLWVDLLFQWLAIRPDQPMEAKRSRLHSNALVLWGEALERYYPYLARFLSIPLEPEFEQRLKYLDAEGLKKQFYFSIRSWIEALARISPLALVLSDLQWIDNASLDLLKYCLPLCERLSLAWMAIFRPDRQSLAWELRHYVETEYPHRLTIVDLRPLNDADSQKLIEEITGEGALSEKTLRIVIGKSEGNPYFIREIVSSMVAQGLLAQDEATHSWHEVGDVASLNLPDSLQSLLLERIDRLSQDERRILQAGSAMGHSFWSNILEVLVNGSANLQAGLNSLQRRGLIQERSQVPGLGMEYSFNSSLVHDVVYDSLLAHQKASFHQRIADHLEDCSCLDNWLHSNSMIAYHFHHAGNPNKELFYTMKAAEQARSLYANTEAYDHLTRSLEILAQLESSANELAASTFRTLKFEVLSERSSVNFLLGRHNEGDVDARALLPLAELIDDGPYWHIDALLRQPEVNAPQNRPALLRGVEMAQEALNLSHSIADRNRELRSLVKLTDLKYRMRDDAWRALSDEALKLAGELGDKKIRVELLLGASASYGLDEIDTSMRYLQEALPLCEELGDRSFEMRLLRAFAEQYERAGDYYRQLVDFEQKRLQLSREIGDRIAEGESLMYCGQVQSLYLGEYEAGLEQLEESLRLWEGTAGSLFPLLRIAQVQVALGRYHEAQSSLESARPYLENNIWNLSQAGYILLKQILNDHLVGAEYARETIELNEEVSRLVADKLFSRQYLMASVCKTSAAHLHLAASATGEERQAAGARALASSRQSYDMYQQFGFVQVIECSSEEILFRHSQALKFNGQAEEARQMLARAYAEMMRKYELLPQDGPWRKSYLGRIQLHKQIQEAYFWDSASPETTAASPE